MDPSFLKGYEDDFKNDSDVSSRYRDSSNFSPQIPRMPPMASADSDQTSIIPVMNPVAHEEKQLEVEVAFRNATFKQSETEKEAIRSEDNAVIGNLAGEVQALKWEQHIFATDFDPNELVKNTNGPRKAAGGRTGKLAPEAAKQAKEVRKRGACLLCSLSKTKVRVNSALWLLETNTVASARQVNRRARNAAGLHQDIHTE